MHFFLSKKKTFIKVKRKKSDELTNVDKHRVVVNKSYRYSEQNFDLFKAEKKNIIHT